MRLKLFLFCVLFVSGCATVPKKPAFVPAPGLSHVVARGQTLYSIAKAYGVDVGQIMRANNIKNPSQLEVGTNLAIPKALSGVNIPSRYTSNLEYVKRLVGEKRYKVPWRTITLHHSATKEGNAQSFDRNHRRRGMGGLFYHFVIGNGEGSKDGGIEVGWRWKKQVEANRPVDIQICLVGDFSCQSVSSEQFGSMVKLIKVLEEEYLIPVSNIRIHRSIHAKPTECPGRNFPFERLLYELRKN